MDEHPVQLVVTDDLRRSRLTVFFRVLLAIPHVIWILLWSVAVAVAVIFGWVAAVATGRLLCVAASLLRRVHIRYTSHLAAYVAFVANPFPPFDGSSFPYPFEVNLPDPAPQSRWRVLLRLPLAIPALLMAGVLGGVPTSLAVRQVERQRLRKLSAKWRPPLRCLLPRLVRRCLPGSDAARTTGRGSLRNRVLRHAQSLA